MTITVEREHPPPWGYGATLAWALLAFVASAVVAVGFLYWWLHDRSRPLNAHDGVIVSLGILTTVPVQVAVLAWAARWRGWPVADYLGLRWPARRDALLALFWVAVLTLGTDAVLYAVGRDLVTSFQVEAHRTAQNAGWLPAFWIAIVLFAPLGEEIVFRGFLYRGLARRPGHEPYAIVGIALGWALLHIQYDWLGIFQVFAIGLLLGWFRWVTGSTALAIVMHVLINLQATIETAIKVEWMS